MVMSVLTLVELGDKNKLGEKLEELKEQSSSKELHERSAQGHSPLELAALLGNKELVLLLVEHGADVNSCNKSGYTAMHYGAAWGRLDCLKVLGESNAQHLALNRHKESPRDIALRYGHLDCVSYLESHEMRHQLEQVVNGTRHILGDSEKIAGKWNKDDRSKVNALCNEYSDWLARNREGELESFRQQKENFQQRMEYYLAKLSG